MSKNAFQIVPNSEQSVQMEKANKAFSDALRKYTSFNSFGELSETWLNSEQDDEVSDTTKDDSSNEAK